MSRYQELVQFRVQVGRLRIYSSPRYLWHFGPFRAVAHNGRVISQGLHCGPVTFAWFSPRPDEPDAMGVVAE